MIEEGFYGAAKARISATVITAFIATEISTISVLVFAVVAVFAVVVVLKIIVMFLMIFIFVIV